MEGDDACDFVTAVNTALHPVPFGGRQLIRLPRPASIGEQLTGGAVGHGRQLCLAVDHMFKQLELAAQVVVAQFQELRHAGQRKQALLVFGAHLQGDGG